MFDAAIMVLKYYAKVHRADESLGLMQLLRPQTKQPITVAQ